MTKYILFTLLTSVIITSCREPSENNDHELQLNNGVKWKINAEMVQPLNQGRKILNEFVNSGSEEYITLASKLTKQNDALISSCTLEGESHDQLHKWLHPHLGLVKQLSKAKSNDVAADLVDQLLMSYQEFDRYFALE